MATFQFDGIPAQRSLLKALDKLREMNREERTEIPEAAPCTFGKPKWAPFGFKDSGIDRCYYELCESRVSAMLSFKSFQNARIVLAGIELIQKLKKGQYGVPFSFWHMLPQYLEECARRLVKSPGATELDITNFTRVSEQELWPDRAK